MSNLPDVVTGLIGRFGQPCTVTWKAVGSGSNALPAQTLTTAVRISSRNYVNAAGQLATAITGMMPTTDRNLQGAIIAVGTTKYTVVGNTETIYQGAALFQKVQLAAG